MIDSVRAEKFWSLVEKRGPHECWPWRGYITWNGYGRFQVGKKGHVTHRIAVALSGRAVPGDLVVDHLCRNRACYNPIHLRVCTKGENTLAPHSQAVTAINRLKTHCKHGHPFDEQNTKFVIREGRARRHCRRCINDDKIRHRKVLATLRAARSLADKLGREG